MLSFYFTVKSTLCFFWDLLRHEVFTVFGVISVCIFRTFTHNMLAFGLSKKLCNDFLKKQAVIGNLNEGKALKE